MDLPEPLARALKILGDLPLGDEPLATCASCAMAPRTHPVPGRVAFTAGPRCCTYHPNLANWLVGRALRRGGPGAAQVRLRLQDPEGVTPLGIGPGPTRARAWRTRADDAFGRDETLTCPYWVEQGLGCSIHLDRDAVCRTWFCKVSAGGRGAATWRVARVLISTAERALAEACVEALPPDADWEAFFVACADHVDGLDGAAMDEALPRARLGVLTAELSTAVARRDAPLPDLVQPRVSKWVVGEGGVALASFSPYDLTWLPPWIFVLLAKLDGETHWQEAVERTAAEVGQPVPEDLVLWLWQRGLVGPPIAVEGSEEPVLSALPGD